MSTISDFGIPDVAIGGLLHPKHQDRWRVLFSQIGIDGTVSRDLSFQAVKLNRPELSFEELEVHRYNSRAWIAGKHNWNECTMTIEDDLTGQASKVIQSQLQKQKWLIGSEGPYLAVAPEGSKYKFAMQLDMLDGNQYKLESWYLEGCWIKSANYGDLDYEANGKVTITLTVRYDHARQELFNYGDGQGIATGGLAGGGQPGII